MPNSRSPEQAPEDRGESQELLRRQAEALERLATVSDPEYKPRQKVIQRLMAVGIAGGGIVLATYQFALFVMDSYERRGMVANWVEAAREMYEVEGSAAEAGEMLKRAAELGPQDVDVVKLGAYIDGMRAVERLVNLDRPFDKADVEEYGRAMGQAVMLERVDPESPEWAILRGQLALAAGEPDRARTFLNKALAIDPKNAFATLRLALVHLNLANASSDKAVRDRELAECRSGLDLALKLNPQFKWALLWKASVALEVDKDPKIAIKILEQALEIDPRFVNALVTLGICEKSREDWNAAERALVRALAIRPDEALALNELAYVYGAQDKYEIGLRYARRSTDANSGNLLAWTMRGLLARELAKATAGAESERAELFKEAIDAYSKALDLDPRNVSAYVERSTLNRLTGHLQQAGEDARNAVTFGPERTFAWNALGKFQAEAGFHDKAAETFAKVIELDSTFDTAYLDRAKARVASGDRARAAADLDLALEKASAEFRPEILLARGKFLESGGDKERALADFVAARKAQADLFDAWMSEAAVLKALDRLDESKAAAREALQLRPGDEAAREAAGLGTPRKAKASARPSRDSDVGAAQPIPAPFSPEEISAMTAEEARAALIKVSKSRNRSDLSDEVQARLKDEFNLLLERVKKN
ncbi:MAG: tetratricopeptide repeat protein [Proteobacteria bacterium]|nr:tetratricopeptide repeat protein [Pseudomonadota bacterium]